MDRNDVGGKKRQNIKTSTCSAPSVFLDVTKNFNNNVYTTSSVSHCTDGGWAEAEDQRASMPSENCYTCNTRYQIPHVKPTFSAMKSTFPKPDISLQTLDSWHKYSKGYLSPNEEELVSSRKNISSIKLQGGYSSRLWTLTKTHLVIAILLTSLLSCHVAALPIDVRTTMYLSESESEFRSDNPEVVDVAVEDSDLFAKVLIIFFGVLIPVLM